MMPWLVGWLVVFFATWVDGWVVIYYVVILGGMWKAGCDIYHSWI